MRKTLAAALATLLLVAAPSLARADSYAGLYDPTYSSDDRNVQTTPLPEAHVKHVVYPVLGFPSLVEPAGTIGVKILLADGGATTDWTATLESAGTATPEQVSLVVTGNQTFDPATNVYTVEVQVPADALPGVYDLVVASASFTLTNGAPDRQPNAVRVLRPGRKDPSFVVIADSQLEDVRTTESPERMKQMLAEIRLRDPDFCLFVGDMCFGSDYAREYEENWKLFAESGLAIFYVPGNHDGYATVIPPQDASSPATVERDGLNSWRRAIGPTLYSFDWLGLHFVGINSMGGSAERRNAVGMLVSNYGGSIDPDQMDWIEQDVADATARGKQTVLFLHHDPSAALTPDKPSYPLPAPAFAAFQSWNDAASQQRLQALIASQSVSHVLFGHVHHDGYAEVSLGGRSVPFVATTTLLCGDPKAYGYRVVQTSGGVISALDYDGKKQQSVPFPDHGVNVEAALSGPADGSAATLDAVIPNRLKDAVLVRLVLPVQAAPGGLRARGAAVLESVGLAENGAWVAHVSALVPAGMQVTAGVEPDPTGAGLVAGQTGTATSAPSATGTAITTTSPATPASLATKNGPALSLSGPAPGTFTTDGAVAVQGTIDPATAASLTVNGDPVAWAADGSFSTVVPLATGLNVIDVEATDRDGRPSRQLVSVISGEFSPENEPISNAFAVRLNQGSLDAIAALAGTKLGGDALAQALLARNPLYQGSKSAWGHTIVSAQVNATSASFGTPALALSPSSDGIVVHAEIPQVDIAVEAHSTGGIPYSISGHVTADNAVVDATVAVTVANGTATPKVTSSNVALDGFAWGLDGFPSFLTGLAKPLVRKLIEDEVEKQIASVVPKELDKVLASSLGKPIVHSVLGAQASLTLAPTSADFDDTGESLLFDANVAVTPLAGHTPLAAPGSLVTRGTPPVLGGPDPGLLLSVNQDLLDRAGYEAWQAGLMDLRLDPTTAPKYHLPASLPLDAGFVETFLPALQGKLPASDPIAFVVVPREPPVFTPLASPDVLELGLGDLGIELYDVKDPQNPALVASLNVALRVKAGVRLDADDHLRVSIDGRPEVVTSLVSSPVVPELDALGVANLVDYSLPPLLEILAGTWPGVALPVQGPVVPSDITAAADETSPSFLTIQGNP